MTEGNDERLDEIGNSVGYLTGRVDEMSKRMDEGFVGVNRQFDKVDERFKEVERKFDKVDKRFEQVDKRFERVDLRFKEVERKMEDGFAGVNARFDELHGMLFKAAWALAIGLLGLMGVMVAQL